YDVFVSRFSNYLACGSDVGLFLYLAPVSMSMYLLLKDDYSLRISIVHELCIHVLGKSTLACALSRELHYRGHLTYILDGDNVRHGLNRDLSFNGEDRAENIRRVGEFHGIFSLSLKSTLTSFTGVDDPYESPLGCEVSAGHIIY
ncbi:hypothetical protein BHE74_00051055, partial [Ensete ventricosum]